jgi:hypothetical protein
MRLAAGSHTMAGAHRIPRRCSSEQRFTFRNQTHLAQFKFSLELCPVWLVFASHHLQPIPGGRGFQGAKRASSVLFVMGEFADVNRVVDVRTARTTRANQFMQPGYALITFMGTSVALVEFDLQNVLLALRRICLFE